MGITLNQHRKSITQTVTARFSDDKAPSEGLSMFFPSKTTAAKQVSIEVERNLQKIAVDVMRCTDGNRNSFSKSSEKIFVPPYYNEYFDFTACQRYDEVFGSIAAGGNPGVYDVRALLGSATDYALKLKYKIARAKELQRAQVLQTGIVTLKNGDNIDYKRTAESLVQLTGSDQWLNLNTADPLAKLDAGSAFLRKKGLSSGNTIDVIMGQNAATNFLGNAKVAERAKFFNQIMRTDIGMPQLDNVTGMTFIGRIAGTDFNYNIFTYSGFYTDESGNQVDYLDTDTVVMIAKDFVGITQHAGVPAILNVPNIGQIVAPKEGEYYVRDVIDQVNMAWQYYVSSAPLAIPISVDRIYTIKTKV